jgi:hypothetical protein
MIPPVRLDPWTNIVNVHWPKKSSQSGVPLDRYLSFTVSLLDFLFDPTPAYDWTYGSNANYSPGETPGTANLVNRYASVVRYKLSIGAPAMHNELFGWTAITIPTGYQPQPTGFGEKTYTAFEATEWEILLPQRYIRWYSPTAGTWYYLRTGGTFAPLIGAELNDPYPPSGWGHKYRSGTPPLANIWASYKIGEWCVVPEDGFGNPIPEDSGVVHGFASDWTTAAFHDVMAALPTFNFPGRPNAAIVGYATNPRAAQLAEITSIDVEYAGTLSVLVDLGEPPP